VSRPKSQKAQYDARNREAAELILDDVDRHGGDDAALVRWARAVETKAEQGKLGPVPICRERC
jgi:hypothetical protein